MHIPKHQDLLDFEAKAFGNNPYGWAQWASGMARTQVVQHGLLDFVVRERDLRFAHLHVPTYRQKLCDPDRLTLRLVAEGTRAQMKPRHTSARRRKPSTGFHSRRLSL